MKNDEKKTLGFGVNNAPIWLCKELDRESEEFYAGVYWPVIVDWYRKAKLLELQLNPNQQSMGPMNEPEEEIQVEKKDEKPGIGLFGGETVK